MNDLKIFHGWLGSFHPEFAEEWQMGFGTKFLGHTSNHPIFWWDFRSEMMNHNTHPKEMPDFTWYSHAFGWLDTQPPRATPCPFPSQRHGNVERKTAPFYIVISHLYSLTPSQQMQQQKIFKNKTHNFNFKAHLNCIISCKAPIRLASFLLTTTSILKPSKSASNKRTAQGRWSCNTLSSSGVRPIASLGQLSTGPWRR